MKKNLESLPSSLQRKPKRTIRRRFLWHSEIQLCIYEKKRSADRRIQKMYLDSMIVYIGLRVKCRRIVTVAQVVFALI